MASLTDQKIVRVSMLNHMLRDSDMLRDGEYVILSLQYTLMIAVYKTGIDNYACHPATLA